MPALTESNIKTSPTSRTSAINDARHKSPEIERRAQSPRAVSKSPEAPKRALSPPAPVAPKDVKETKDVKDEKPVKSASADKDEDIMNMETFQQILELDEDEDERDFSWAMADAFFSQALATFESMDKAFAQKNLKLLSEQGHFLKGSSAALGVKKVQDSCENIQHYGKLWDEVAGVPITSEEALKRIGALLVVVKADFEQAEKWLKNWFRNNSSVQVD